MDVLSEQHVQALRLSSDTLVIPDKLFDFLIENVCEVILNKPTQQKIIDCKHIDGVHLDAVKQAHFSLMTLFLESAKSDIESDQMSMVLDDCYFSDSRKESFMATFNQYKTELRRHLGSYGFKLPNIVNATWRLDYNIKNNQLSKLNELRYTISLKKDNSQETNFSCSKEELQDFIGKLKEATKALERASQT